ncbi:hypothetical protein SAMN04488132_107140 [Sediminibacterium ginsengisoli]|uniref:Uncharacterized protein n=1 Tax=Sediminibacterium ginsengisoli TaxID=413434 RepID=A0A1T4Q4K9_9BACT|nr:hypothetical protein SAMN04488132_107140 [Sediminibacterium ginsengisoli]
MHQSRQCRKCKKGTLDTRVERAMVIKKLFFWLPIKRYRCSHCYRRTYLFTTSDVLEPDYDAFPTVDNIFHGQPQPSQKHKQPSTPKYNALDTRSPRIYANGNSGDVKIRYKEKPVDRYTSTYTRI